MSRDMVFETVPEMTRRVGDTLVANQNNATILLGRDRVSGVESGYGSLSSSEGGKGAGAIHLMVGRQTINPDVSGDAATLYISARSDPDSMAGTVPIGRERKAVSAALLRADCVRIVPRTDFKLSVGRAYLLIDSEGRVTIEGDVSLGAGASDRILKGDTFVRLVHVPHTHPTAVGPTGPPIQQVPDSVYSPSNKVK